MVFVKINVFLHSFGVKVVGLSLGISLVSDI